MGKPTSFRPSDENEEYMREQAGDAGLTPWLNSILDMLRTANLVPATATPATEGKSKEELQKERLAVEIRIKQQQADMHALEIDHSKLDLIIKELKAEKLRRELDRNPPTPRPGAPPAVQSINAEIAKDTATPEPRKKPTSVRELPPGQGIVGCDNCHETFIFDNADKGLDDFLDHLKEKHPFRREQVSNNEANQFRHARTRIERGVSA